MVKLQAGDAENLKAWEMLCEMSRREYQVIYDLLGVQLEERGESFYNPMLSTVIEDLKGDGLLEESDGAQVVFTEGTKVSTAQDKCYFDIMCVVLVCNPAQEMRSIGPWYTRNRGRER